MQQVMFFPSPVFDYNKFQELQKEEDCGTTTIVSWESHSGNHSLVVFIPDPVKPLISLNRYIQLLTRLKIKHFTEV